MGSKEKNEQSAMWFSLIFGAAMIVSSAGFALAPKVGGKVAVITWPWKNEISAIGVISRANARIVTEGRSQWVAIAFDDAPELNTRLYKAGATFVLDANFVIACGGLTKW